MSEEKLKKLMLDSLYNAQEINQIWQENRHNSLIKHPEYGWISPNKYRSLFVNKPCPYCGKKMVQGDNYSTNSKEIAIKKGYEYQYQNSQGKLIKTINQAGNIYYHINYVTLDHKLNKARFPELLFDFNNLEVICWRCNNEKKDNNAFEIKKDLDYFTDLLNITNDRYQTL
jgi:5-methylcytosine-specific restriction endonuclease McrA